MRAQQRMEDVLDRLAEMEHALPRLRDRSPAAAGYILKELEQIIEECTTERDRWQEVLDRAHRLAGRPDGGPDAQHAASDPGAV